MKRRSTFFRDCTLASVGLFLLSTCSQAFAQSPPTLCPHPQTQEPGMWLDIELSRDALSCMQTAPEREVRYHLLEDQLALSSRRVAVLEQSNDAATESLEQLGEALSRTQRERDDAVDARRAWFRSPLLWFCVGLVLGGGAVTAVAASL
jgi:hypothetical protein